MGVGTVGALVGTAQAASGLFGSGGGSGGPTVQRQGGDVIVTGGASEQGIQKATSLFRAVTDRDRAPSEASTRDGESPAFEFRAGALAIGALVLFLIAGEVL